MSAFIISTETMQRAVAAIDKARMTSFAGMPTDTPRDLDAIGKALFRINQDAVNYRYRDKQKAPRFTYRPLGEVTTADQYKAIGCLLYQCSEGNAPDCDLYKALDTMHDALAHQLANEASRNVPWDWAEL